MFIIQLVVKEEKVGHWCRSSQIPLHCVQSACGKWLTLITKDGRSNYKTFIDKDDVSGLIDCIICSPKFEKMRAAKIESQRLKELNQ
jgi:hypothetical protein